MSLLDTAVEAVEPWYVSLPLKLLGGIKSALAWAVKHPGWAVAAVMALVAVWAHHGQSVAIADASRSHALNGKWAHIYAVEHHSNVLLFGALAMKNAETLRRAKAYADAQAKDRADNAAAVRRAAAQKKRADIIAAMLADKRAVPCPITEDLSKVTEGL